MDNVCRVGVDDLNAFVAACVGDSVGVGVPRNVTVDAGIRQLTLGYMSGPGGRIDLNAAGDAAQPKPAVAISMYSNTTGTTSRFAWMPICGANYA